MAAENLKKSTAYEPKKQHLATLSLAALGVVFGDIGTSPIYAIRECFHGEYGIVATPANVLGVLSLMFWALTIIVSLKYLTFILQADNNGEGGVIALTSLIRPQGLRKVGMRPVLVSFGLFAACLLYGDGMITPAISVLSALEGLKVISPDFTPFVIPLTVVILVALFLLQRRGTAKMGKLFGPVIFIWFSILALLGVGKIIACPRILAAFFPWYGVGFLLHNHLHGFLILGAVFLVVTGAEALYADLGHFGPRPIRLVWIFFVLPSLLLNYFGQGALLLLHPESAHDPFFALLPRWGVIPIIILATAATIIASQAVISGAFSLTRQAIQLGYLPRMKIIHTAARHMGQIYVPLVNWLLMICTIGLVLGFQSSSKLAAAYGVAVTSTMLISTILFYVVATERWGWKKIAVIMLIAIFLVVDSAFFLANISKVLHGAWFPLVIGAVIFSLMVIWRRGRKITGEQIRSLTMNFKTFQEMIAEAPPKRVKGQAVFMTGNPDSVPVALLHNLKHNKILHSEVALLHFDTSSELPRVPNDQKVEVIKNGGGFYRVTAHYGFMEEPRISNLISLAREKGMDFDLEKTAFFLGRINFMPSGEPQMPRWQSRIFTFLSRNELDAASYFDIPSSQVIDLGVPLQL
jgi:KUP system potassium uptake protein